MKNHTHPLTVNTLILTKDGSSYIKYWNYLRATLILEGDSKKWENSKSRNFVDMNKLNEITDKKNQQFNINSFKQQIAQFWIN